MDSPAPTFSFSPPAPRSPPEAMTAHARTEAVMASRAVEISATGRHVAESISRLRRGHGWEQRDLAEHVTKAGRAMSASVLSKIESGARRVDVDDLVAIAAALEVTPALLLLAAPAGDSPEVPSSPPAGPTSVATAVRADLEAMGELVGLEPSLAQMALRLAVEMDHGGGEDGRQLPALNRELRITLQQLADGRQAEDDDDGLGDLDSPA